MLGANSNITELYRHLSVGDKVKLANVIKYTITRVDGYNLYGIWEEDRLNRERWITRDYRKAFVMTLGGKAQVIRIVHLDGTRIK